MRERQQQHLDRTPRPTPRLPAPLRRQRLRSLARTPRNTERTLTACLDPGASLQGPERSKTRVRPRRGVRSAKATLWATLQVKLCGQTKGQEEKEVLGGWYT